MAKKFKNKKEEAAYKAKLAARPTRGKQKITSLTGVEKGLYKIERAKKKVAERFKNAVEVEQRKLGIIDRYKHLTAGKPRAFATPEDLIAAFEDYYKWNEENPLQESKWMNEEGILRLVTIPRKRMLSLAAFCIYCGHTESLIRGMRHADFKGREEYGTVIDAIQSIVAIEQVEGAASDLLNANIIARIQGLKERIDNTSDDKPMTMPSINVYNSGPKMANDEKDIN